MLINTFQEALDIEKSKPKIKKAKAKQKEFEKGKIWAISKDFAKETRVLTNPCPRCNSGKITVENKVFTCTKCNLIYRIDELLGTVASKYEYIKL